MVRFERQVDLTRTRYVKATTRVSEAMSQWCAAAVPLDCADHDVPAWSAAQAAATDRVAKAWAELAACRKDWEALLRELGYQR